VQIAVRARDFVEISLRDGNEIRGIRLPGQEWIRQCHGRPFLSKTDGDGSRLCGTPDARGVHQVVVVRGEDAPRDGRDRRGIPGLVLDNRGVVETERRVAVGFVEQGLKRVPQSRLE